MKRSEEDVMGMYEEWMIKNNKVYNALGEKERRLEAFKDNLRFIEKHNSVENTTYKLGLNRFADLTSEEYRALYLGTKSDPKRRIMKAKNTNTLTLTTNTRQSLPYAYNNLHTLPHHVDWRLKGAVTPVKDQGSCGNL